MLSSLEYLEKEVDYLNRTSALNEAFHIWHDGRFGTINGERLGRTAQHHVEWDEINAGWGHVSRGGGGGGWSR